MGQSEKWGRAKKLFEHNIFLFRPWDGCLYLFCYLIIPIVTTVVSLFFSTQTYASTVYCYVSIFICTLNCIYDAINRFDEIKSVKNLKLAIIIFVSFISTIYSIVVVFVSLVSGEIIWTYDWCLLSYLIAAGIAFMDVLTCLFHKACLPSAVL